jgi:hypothetical protein
MGMSELDEYCCLLIGFDGDVAYGPRIWSADLRPIYSGWIEQSPDELARAS